MLQNKSIFVIKTFTSPTKNENVVQLLIFMSIGAVAD